MNPKKVQKKIAKLRKKGKLIPAIELQRQLCQADHQNVEAWSLLASLAAEARLTDLELATRFCIAKLSRIGPDAWVELAARAEAAGFEADAVEALFRAADAAALLGEARRAAELCDRVLAKDSDHRPARRIRGLMAARLVRMESIAEVQEEEEEFGLAERGNTALWGDWDEPSISTISYVSGMVDEGLAVDPQEVKSFEEMVSTSKVPAASTPDAQGQVKPAGFVLAPQRWPSVLDQQSLMFVGSIDDIDHDVVALAEPITLQAEEAVYTQGEEGHLFYCLDDGEVHASRKRGFVQDLGTITAGSFFGEVVTIAGFPSTTTVETVCSSTLRVLTRDKLNNHLKRRSVGVEKVISSLRSWYLETVVSICPLFAYCDHDQLRTLTDSSHWVTFKPGELLARQDHQGGLHVILTGVAKVSVNIGGRAVPLGRLSTGDMVGEMEPPPVTVTAECTVLAIAIDRDLLHDLPEMAQAEVKARFTRCWATLEEAHTS